MDELNLLRLDKIKKERNELLVLKTKYDIFNINRFSLDKEKQSQYKRNINIVRKLVKILPRNNFIPFQIYIENIKKERIKYSQNKILIRNICSKNSIPEDIVALIIEKI